MFPGQPQESLEEAPLPASPVRREQCPAQLGPAGSLQSFEITGESQSAARAGKGWSFFSLFYENQ